MIFLECITRESVDFAHCSWVVSSDFRFSIPRLERLFVIRWWDQMHLPSSSATSRGVFYAPFLTAKAADCSSIVVNSPFHTNSANYQVDPPLICPKKSLFQQKCGQTAHECLFCVSWHHNITHLQIVVGPLSPQKRLSKSICILYIKDIKVWKMDVNCRRTAFHS